jgi:hypothetical protein
MKHGQLGAAEEAFVAISQVLIHSSPSHPPPITPVPANMFAELHS